MFKTLQDFLIYGAGETAARIITFVSFLLMTHQLSTAEYGQLETYLVTIGLIGVIGAAGLNNSLQAFYYSRIEYAEVVQSQRISTAFYTLLIWQMALSAASAIVLTFVDHSFSTEHLLLLLSIAVLTVQLQLMQDVFRLRFEPTKYLFSTLLSKGAAAIVSVVLVLKGGGVNGYLWGSTLTLLASFLILFYLLRDALQVHLNRDLAKSLLNYGLPFVLVGFGAWALASLDRWLLASFSGLSAVGEYAFAVRISLLVSFLSVAFGQAWGPMVFKLKETHPSKYLSIYADSFLSFILLLATLAAVISVFASEFQSLLFGNKFKGTSPAILLLSFGAVIQATTHFTAIGISLSRKTHYFAMVTWCAAGISLLGNILLIPKWGIEATAFMSLVANIFLSFMYFILSQREHKMQFLKEDVSYFFALIGYLFIGSAFLVMSSDPFESIGMKMGFLVLAIIGVVFYLREMVLRYER